MDEILIATGNAGKLREYQELLAGLNIRLISPREAGLNGFDVPEDGTTFTENAIIKARAYAKASGRRVVADDSGLCVDALDGAPGLYSARYGGVDATDADRRAKLLDALRDIPADQRTARFVCVTALSDATGESVQTFEGVCEGRIALEESAGQNGFGYDPVFVPDGHTVTFADMDGSIKDAISHRGRATALLLAHLRR